MRRKARAEIEVLQADNLGNDICVRDLLRTQFTEEELFEFRQALTRLASMVSAEQNRRRPDWWNQISNALEKGS